ACGIDKANLQASGLAGGDKAGDADGATALAIAAHGDADAGDDEAAADDDWNIRHAKGSRRLALGRLIELQQRAIGTGAMRQHRIHLEVGMDRDAAQGLQRRVARAVVDDAVFRAGLYAMRRGEDDLRRNKAAGAEVAARADNGDDGTGDAVGG